MWEVRPERRILCHLELEQHRPRARQVASKQRTQPRESPLFAWGRECLSFGEMKETKELGRGL